jgi:hypothetical protein
MTAIIRNPPEAKDGPTIAATSSHFGWRENNMARVLFSWIVRRLIAQSRANAL